MSAYQCPITSIVWNRGVQIHNLVIVRNHVSAGSNRIASLPFARTLTLHRRTASISPAAMQQQVPPRTINRYLLFVSPPLLLTRSLLFSLSLALIAKRSSSASQDHVTGNENHVVHKSRKGIEICQYLSTGEIIGTSGARYRTVALAKCKGSGKQRFATYMSCLFRAVRMAFHKAHCLAHSYF